MPSPVVPLDPKWFPWIGFVILWAHQFLRENSNPPNGHPHTDTIIGIMVNRELLESEQTENPVGFPAQRRSLRTADLTSVYTTFLLTLNFLGSSIISLLAVSPSPEQLHQYPYILKALQSAHHRHTKFMSGHLFQEIMTEVVQDLL